MHDGLPFQQNIREEFLCRSSLSGAVSLGITCVAFPIELWHPPVGKPNDRHTVEGEKRD
jgi:hypothetical protein